MTHSQIFRERGQCYFQILSVHMGENCCILVGKNSGVDFLTAENTKANNFGARTPRCIHPEVIKFFHLNVIEKKKHFFFVCKTSALPNRTTKKNWKKYPGIDLVRTRFTFASAHIGQMEHNLRCCCLWWPKRRQKWKKEDNAQSSECGKIWK